MSAEYSTFNQGNRPFIGNNVFFGNEVRASTLMTAFDTQCFASETLGLNRVVLSDLATTGPGLTREINTRNNPVIVLSTNIALIDLRLQAPKLPNVTFGSQETTIINASGAIQTFDALNGNVAGGAVALAVDTASKFMFLPAETTDPQGDGIWYPLVDA